jgi:hypothetical protein
MTPTPSGLVGRDRPLAELQALVEAALDSRGGLVALTGEAGIGKTTLAAAAADHAEQRGATVVWGACWEGAPPFWPWLEALAALGVDAGLQDRGRPASPSAPSSSAARFERFHAVSSALLQATGSGPLVVVLDDLHWADPASVELAAFHARRARRSPQLLVVTYRDVEVGPGDPLAGPIARLEAEGRTLPLGGLDAPQVAQVLAGVTGGGPDPELGASVQRRTGGNPFLVQQVARLLVAHPGASEVPRGVRDPILRRLAALGDPCLRLLEAAAVLGPDPRPEVLAAVSGQPTGTVLALLGEAAGARVLVAPSGDLGSWRFAHDLFREVLYGQLGPPARARLHLEAAAALEAPGRGGPAARPAELAGHYLRAVDQGGQLPPAAAARAVAHAERAAQEAAAVLADEDAARHYRWALRLGEATGRLDPAGRARLLAGLGEALRRAGDTAGARQAFGRAAELARRDPDGVVLARAALGLHAIGVESGAAPTDVAGLLEDALARTQADPALAAQVGSALAQTLAMAPAPDPERAAAMAGRAAAMADWAVATARATGDGRVLAAALLGKHNVLWGPDTPEERLALLAELERLAAGDEELAAEAELLRSTALLELGDARGTAELASFARRAGHSRLARVRWLGRSREAMLAVLAGDLALADRLATEVRRFGDELGVPDAGHVAAGLRAGVDSLRGRASQDLLDQVDRLVGRVSIPVTSPRAWLLMVLAEGQRPAWADAYAKAALQVVPDEVPRDWMWTRSAVILAELNAAAGAEQACARWYDALAPYRSRTAVAGGAVLFCGAVAHYLGLLAAVTGRPELARRHLEDAAEVHERLGARPWLLRSRLELARLLRGDPDRRDRAAELLGGVRAEAERLGLDGLAAAAPGPAGRSPTPAAACASPTPRAWATWPCCCPGPGGRSPRPSWSPCPAAAGRPAPAWPWAPTPSSTSGPSRPTGGASRTSTGRPPTPRTRATPAGWRRPAPSAPPSPRSWRPPSALAAGTAASATRPSGPARPSPSASATAWPGSRGPTRRWPPTWRPASPPGRPARTFPPSP